MENTIIHHELDTCGLFCPEPVMMLHSRVRGMAVGEVIRVVASDPSTCRDIPSFCRFLNYKLLENIEHDKCYYYLIRKV